MICKGALSWEWEEQACIEDGTKDRGCARRSCRLRTFGSLFDLLKILLPEVEALPLFTQVAAQAFLGEDDDDRPPDLSSFYLLAHPLTSTANCSYTVK